MRNKKLSKSGVLITVVMLSVSGCAGGCSKQAEPVIADATVETPEPEESIPEESEESLEPTPSPTVEPTEEPVEESSSSEEISESEVDTSENEEVVQDESESDLGYEIIPIDEVTMYCTSNSANIRKGPNTSYDKVGTLSYAQEIVVNGKVETADSTWYVIKTDNSEDIQMVSGSLLSTTKPQPQQTTTPSNNTGSTGNTTQQPSGGDSSQPSGGGGGSSSSGGLVTDDGAPAWGTGTYTPPGEWIPGEGLN